MEQKYLILAYTILPLLLIFIIAIFSQYYALEQTRIYINEYIDMTFNDQLMYSKQYSQIICQQLSAEIQNIPYFLRMLNTQKSRGAAGEVIFNQNYNPPLIHQEMLHLNEGDPQVIAEYLKNPLYIKSWYQQNITDFNDLSLVDRTLLYNTTRLNPLINAIFYSNQFKDQFSNRTILYFSVPMGYVQDGLGYTTSYNTTFSSIPPVPGCGYPGKYQTDLRCRYWFRGTQNSSSIQFFQPGLLAFSGGLSVGSSICQRLMRYSQNSQVDELDSVMCFSTILQSMENFFSNFERFFEVSYVIDPISQLVIYDSLLGNLDSTTLLNITSVEFQTQDSLRQFNTILKSSYNSSILLINDTFELKGMSALQKNQQVFSYNKNNSQHQIVFTPVYVVEKLPQFRGVQSPQPKGYQIRLSHLTINIISNESLQKQSSDLQSQFSKLYLAVSICLAFLGIFSIILAFYYSIKLMNLFFVPITHLTDILKKIQIQDNLADLSAILSEYQLNTDEIFFSQETQELYESFESVFKMLQYTSENFFTSEQTQILLNLHKQMEFFQKFRNTRALGVCHNNIGSIFLTQSCHFQALEHLSSAILYAQYEIQDFCNTHNSCNSSQINLSQYCFNDYHIKCQQLELSTTNHNNTDQHLSLAQQFAQNYYQQNAFFQDTNKKYLSQFQSQQKQSKSAYKKCQESKSKGVISTRNSSIPMSNGRNIKSITQINDSQLENQEENHQNIIEKSEQMLLEIQEQEQRMNLLLNLFYRKKNYITALISYQEQIVEQQVDQYKSSSKPLPCKDQQQNSQVNVFNKQNQISKLHNQSPAPKLDNKVVQLNSKQYRSVQYNFWEEIERLLEDLLLMSLQIPQSYSQQIDILCMLSKSQFKQNKISLAFCSLQISQDIFLKMQINKKDNKNINYQYHIKYKNISQSQRISESNAPRNIKDLNISKRISDGINKKRQSQLSSIEDKQEKENSFSNSFHKQKNSFSSIYNQELTNSKPLKQEDIQTKLPNKIQQSQNLQYSKEQQQDDIRHPNINRNYLSVDLIGNPQLLSSYPNHLYNQIDKTHQTSFKKVNRNSNPEQTQQRISDSNSCLFQQEQSKTKLKYENESHSSLYKHIMSRQRGYDEPHFQNEDTLLQIPIQLERSDYKKSMRQTLGVSYLDSPSSSASHRYLRSISSQNALLVKGLYNNESSKEIKQLFNKNQIFNKITRPTAYQAPSKPKITLEKHFADQRNADQQYSNYQLDRSYQIKDEVLECIINYSLSELFIYTKDYPNAALKLTSILENSKMFISNYPWKIISSLKQNFDMMNLQVEDISKMYTQYSQKVALKVVFICSSQSDEKHNLNTLSLISDSIDSVLVREDDQIAIITIHQYDNLIQTYMDFTKSRNAKSFIHSIISDIQQFITVKSVDSLLKLKTMSSLEDVDGKIQDQFQYESPHLNFNHIETYLYNSCIQEVQLSKNIYKNSKILDYIELNKQTNSVTDKLKVDQQYKENMKSSLQGKINNYGQKKLNEHSNMESPIKYQEQQYQEIEKLEDLELLGIIDSPFGSVIEKNDIVPYNFDSLYHCMHNQNVQQPAKVGQNIYSRLSQLQQLPMTESHIQLQLLKNDGDESLFEDRERLDQIQKDEESNFSDQNQQTSKDMIRNNISVDQNKKKVLHINLQFHISIRKALSDLFASSIQFCSKTYSLSVKSNKKYKTEQTDQLNDKTFQQKFENNKQSHDLQFTKNQKYIVYFMEDICIFNNRLFEELCKMLYLSQIQILLLTNKQGNHFLEVSNQLFYYNNQIIFRVFYQVESVLHFFQSQRNSSHNNSSITFIQHF